MGFFELVLLTSCFYREFLTTTSATTLEDFTSILRRHSGAETMGAGAFNSAWLVCTFHKELLEY